MSNQITFEAGRIYYVRTVDENGWPFVILGEMEGAFPPGHEKEGFILFRDWGDPHREWRVGPKAIYEGTKDVTNEFKHHDLRRQNT